MDTSELDRLVEQIGEQILARVQAGTLPAAGLGVAAGPAAPSAPVNYDAALAAMIDHTILRADATRDDIVKLCQEARTYKFAAVCVNGFWVPLCAKELEGSGVKVCTVVGFPLGAMATEAKRYETEAAIRVGATEVDMVINIGALKGGDLDTVKMDVQALADVCHRNKAILKVIIETSLLDDQQKIMACTIAKVAGADFVKTSTGFSTAGANEKDVALMRSVVGPNIGVKASGGVRTLEDAKKMIAAGANRIGASSSVKIVEASAGR